LVKIDPSKRLASQDKLKVFVSSTIDECAEERKSAVAGIRQTNHEPIIFEKLGARPYRPRDVYLSRLYQSQIIVAIYKNRYGSVADGMDISGLEDEYRHARTDGKPILVYINRDATAREPRLKALVDEILATSEITVSFYDKPEELIDRIKDDVTAEITQHFLDAPALEEAMQRRPATAIDLLAPPGGFIRRVDVLNRIDALADVHSSIAVVGEAGSGKTVLLTQLAERPAYSIVYGGNLSPKELFAVLANMLQGNTGDAIRQFATYEGARLAFASSWVETGPRRILLDDSSHMQAVKDTIAQAGAVPASSRKVLVYSQRPDGAPLSEETPAVRVPPLSLVEVQAIVRNAMGSGIIDADVLLRDTAGNPLKIRQTLVASGRSTAQLWDGLSASVREIITYLTIADAPLTTEDLLGLRGDTSYLAEQMFTDLSALSELVVGTGTGFRIIHESVRDELWEIVKSRLERLQFAAGRLGRYLSKEGKVVTAYFSLVRAGHKDSSRLIEHASFEAGRSGDWRASLLIAKDALARAAERLDLEQQIRARVSLAQAYEMTGDNAAAQSEMSRARLEAQNMPEDLRLFVEGAALTFEASLTLTSEAISKLAAHCDTLLEAGRTWDAARISISLSCHYINVHDSAKAESEARRALAVFEEVGDDYGVDIARRNLASALVAQPSKAQEADALIRLIEQSDSDDGRRSRAWLCNVLVRKNRRAGRLDEAEARAREAISIGHDLGDEMLVAINSIGLANVLNDREDYAGAIAAYDQAAIGAQKCGRRDVEAHASYLAAETYNELPESHPLSAEAAKRAEHLARYAIGLMRDTIAKDHLGRAYEALGDALFGQGVKDEAIESLFTAASFAFQVEDWDSFERRIMTASINCPEDNIDLYLSGIRKALDVELPALVAATPVERLFQPIPMLLRSLPHTAILPIFGLHIARTTRALPITISRRLTDLVFQELRNVAIERPDEPWRFLYPTIVLVAGTARALSVFDLRRISDLIASTIRDIAARPEPDGGTQWLVTLSLPSPVAISVLPLDDTKQTILASLLLVAFLKGFELDLRREFFAGVVVASEMQVVVADATSMPPDIQSFVSDSLEAQPCVVSRPTNIEVDRPEYPTSVFLGSSFLDELFVGKGRGGSLQILFGLALKEIVFRLLRGTVDLDALAPKVVKLVRQSIS
jgi:tetratricopeptide (TPR) repeat protein